MVTSNHERVGKALELLRDGLRPYIERSFQDKYGATWRSEAGIALRSDQPWQDSDGEPNFDAAALLILMSNRWNEVFASVLGYSEPSYVSELRTVRNRWAHQETFTTGDTQRALYKMARLLSAASAPEAQEVMRLRNEEQPQREVTKASAAPVEGQPKTRLPSRREVVTPQRNVASGRDLTKFTVTTPQGVRERLGKGRAILIVVRSLCAAGVPVEDIQKILQTEHRYGYVVVRSAPGNLDGATFVAAVAAKSQGWASNQSKFRRRYFCADGDLVRTGGHTYALTSQWGLDTQPAIEALLRKFPDRGVSCTPAGD